jgi:NADP-dependent 3-hydroxy acid dehydrogenase YdfG/aryl carrier-like protein
VLSGGLGGLGRSLSKWMIDHGATHLAFLSRSGTRKPKAQILLAEILAKGIDARAYVCDIGNGKAVQQAVQSIQQEMPPIHGVIQAAMSLADAAFINMTPAQWSLSVNPKAPGTWNLHQHMPKNLDFFVMLSSSSGIAGTRGQGNYAAGNTFQDALAHYRRHKGLSAVTIDVGPVLGAGYVAENAELIESLGAQGYVALREEEFIGLIQAAITGVTVSGIPCPGQVITGFATGGLVAAEGWEMPYYLEDAKMQHIVNVDVSGSGAGDDGVSILQQIREITSVSAGADIVSAALAQKLAKLMMISADDLDVSKPISTYGVDSLTAVELRAWSFRELQSDISIFDIMSNVPITTLARMMVSKSKIVSKEVITADN